MTHPTIAIIVGSLRKGSLNLRLGRALERQIGNRATCFFVELAELPLYNQDDDGQMPAASQHFHERIRVADAVLFVTPEYNRSIPGVLKNAIDIGSRPSGQSVWSGKPAAICGASPGNVGTAVAQQHLRTILAHLDMRVLGQPEIFLKSSDDLIDDQGQIGDERTHSFLAGFVDRFIDWIPV